MIAGHQAKYLGLAGYAGSGKDYVYEYLKTHRGEHNPTHRVAFADGVRDEVTQIMGLADPVQTFTKPYTKEVRFVLQQWGTELRRNEDRDYWVKYGMGVADEIVACYPGAPLLVVFTDVRFGNEALAIQEAGGRVLFVEASRKVRLRRLGGVSPEYHPSEVFDFDVDARVFNNKDGRAPIFTEYDADWLGL